MLRNFKCNYLCSSICHQIVVKFCSFSSFQVSPSCLIPTAISLKSKSSKSHLQSYNNNIRHLSQYVNNKVNMEGNGDTKMEVDGGVTSLKLENKTSAESDSAIREGKVKIEFDTNKKVFYNPTQEINRDISVLAINTFIERVMQEDAEREAVKKKKVNRNFKILEAMAASGIRSIRYAKEIDNVSKILANDLSRQAIESLKSNSVFNETTDIIEPNCEDATLLMLSRKEQFFVVDLDPYGSPIPFLDSAIQCVQNGGLLLVTATDMAILAGGNHPETCYYKYGSVAIKTRACQEMALRILIHAVQSFANRYGKHVEPVLSLKIDFYVRILFKVTHSPIRCKQTPLNTSMLYECIGCHRLIFQPLIGQKGQNFTAARGPPMSPNCDLCGSNFHIGGPIWTGLIHNKEFVSAMEQNVSGERFEYLGTRKRIQGLLQLVLEEIDTPLYYETSQISSVFKCRVIPIISLRSAILNLGYKISSSHAEVGTYKTDAPMDVIYEMHLEWLRQGNDGGGKIKDGSPGSKIIQTLDSRDPATRPDINFTIHPDANPASREAGLVRFQRNPTKYWGPGSKDKTRVNLPVVVEIDNSNQLNKKKEDPGSPDGGISKKQKLEASNSESITTSDNNS